MIQGLYAITPDLLDTELLLDKVELALQGGASILQYRNKLANHALMEVQSRALRTLTRQYCAIFIVNDDLQLALSVDADGVHLGGSDGDLQTARDVLPVGKLLGASCYNDLSLAKTAIRAGADYVAFGAVFPSGTKPTARRASPELIAQARGEFSQSIVAIGGITPENGQQVVCAGANCLAVIGSLFEAEDVKARAQEFTNLFHVKP